MEQQDYYKILKVETSESQQKIKESYRKLALKYHPDHNRDDAAAAARMKAINESYAVLSDSQKRSRYDALRQTYGDAAHDRFKQTYSEQDIFRGSDIQQIFEQFSRAFGLRGFDEVFKDSYGSGYRSFEFRRPNAFGKVFVGGQGQSQGRGRPGSGFPLGGHLGRLIKYGLKKKWGIELPERGKDVQDVIAVSREMLQSGGKISYLCRKNQKELLVTIPPGMKAGQKIRLKGMGEPGKGGAESGDLYVEVQVRNPLFQKISKSARGILSSLKKLGNS